jgi:hypothetical protein
VYCLFVFTSSCLLEGSCLVCSFLPPVVCRRAHVLDVRLYLQLFVGGLMYCLFVLGGKNEQTRHEPSNKQLEVKTNKQCTSPPTKN